MKHIFLPTVSFMLAVCLSAFIPRLSVRENGYISYFIYTSISQSPSSLSNPLNYEYTGTYKPCVGGPDECAVEVAAMTTPRLYSTLVSQPNGAVTFNTITGVPDGGTEFLYNLTSP